MKMELHGKKGIHFNAGVSNLWSRRGGVLILQGFEKRPAQILQAHVGQVEVTDLGLSLGEHSQLSLS